MKSSLDQSVLKQIRADLGHGTAAARADAVEALAALGDRRGLVRALGSEDPYLRCVAVRGLAHERGARFAWRLAHRIRDEDELVRRHAACALGQRGEWIARFGLRLLVATDRSAAVRCEALAALSDTVDADADRVLIGAVTGDADGDVRAFAEHLLASRARRAPHRCACADRAAC